MGCESPLSFLVKENGELSSGPAARHRKSWKLETSGGLVRRRVDLLRNTLGGRGHFRGDLFTGLGCQFGCLAACLLHVCRKSLHGAREKLGLLLREIRERLAVLGRFVADMRELAGIRERFLCSLARNVGCPSSGLNGDRRYALVHAGHGLEDVLRTLKVEQVLHVGGGGFLGLRGHVGAPFGSE